MPFPKVKVRNWSIEYSDDSQKVCRFTKDGWFTEWQAVARQKNGNFDKFWLLRELRLLDYRLWHKNNPNGQRSPIGYTYTGMTPTTGTLTFTRGTK